MVYLFPPVRLFALISFCLCSSLYRQSSGGFQLRINPDILSPSRGIMLIVNLTMCCNGCRTFDLG